MSTPTSEAPRAGGAARLAAAAALLTVCLAADAASAQDSGAARTISVAGPEGYCVDAARSEPPEAPEAGGFAILGHCAALTEGAGGAAPATAALLTVRMTAVVPPWRQAPPRPEAIAAVLRSPEGRAALALDGRAESVTVADARSEAGVLYVKLRDSAAGRPDALADTAWAAVLPLRGRLVALTVTAPADDLPGEDAAQGKLDAFVAAMRKANGSSEAAVSTKGGHGP